MLCRKVLFTAALALSVVPRGSFAVPPTNSLPGANDPRILEYRPEEGVYIRPESERYLDHLIIGLNRQDNKYFLLPDVSEHTAQLGKSLERVSKILFMLDFEFSHGRIMQEVPSYTHLYVAVPDSVKGSSQLHNEEKWFKDYLIERAGWSKQRVESNVHFFTSPVPLLWARDVSKIIAFDREGRAVLGTSVQQAPEQLSALEALRNAFPEKFVLKQYEPNIPQISPRISVEGGDLEIVVNPSGKTELLVGRHRVLRYLRSAGLLSEDAPDTTALSKDMVESARRAYAESFYKLPVTFVPQQILEEPSRGSSELFHLDMIVTVLPPVGDSRPRAFVPSYMFEAVDALQDTRLDLKIVAKMQDEYNLVALQFEAMGYEVLRLPIADHPVRSPANIGKYRDRETGKTVVLLSKYPHHIPIEAQTPRDDFLQIYYDLDAAGLAFLDSHSQESLDKLISLLDGVWGRLDAIASKPNPLFEMTRAIFEQKGYVVKGVPDYTYGSGGIHCKILQ